MLLTLTALVAKHGPLPHTPSQRTGSGGLQIFFAHAPGVQNSAGRIGVGLDIRGDGGYVVVAPSVVEEEGRTGVYTWEVPPFTTPLAPMPEWLLALILRAQGPIQSGTPSYDRGRNDMLFRMGCALRLRRRNHSEIEDTIRMENLEKCRPPLPEHEVSRIIRSVFPYPVDWERPDLPNPEHDRSAARSNVHPPSEGLHDLPL